MHNGKTSFWLHGLDAPSTRPPLPGDRDYDIVIVGGGLTGLWTAYWTATVNPGARIAVLEARHVGYGASGRNGGWLSGKMVGLRRHLANGPHGQAGVLALQRACFDAISDILALLHEHGHDVDAAHSGYLQVARTPAEQQRINDAVAADHNAGLTEDDVRILGERELRERVHVDGAASALYSPHNACLNPAKLVRAVAALAEGTGVTIYEQTAAEDIEPGRVKTARGTVRADVVLRATEAYTATLAGHRRDLLPMNSSMIVTEPLDDKTWAKIGWERREGVSGASHRYFYAQRTADGRIALGGRGLPYRYGSRLDQDGKLDRWTIKQLRNILHSAFPDVAGVDVAHAWCGVLGVPRDWTPTVRLDPGTRLGMAGGYVGQGVTASYLAARTLADLVAGQQSAYTELPWTNREWKRWEPEPLRFTGAYGIYGLYQIADSLEHATGRHRTAVPARLADALSGRH